MDTVNFPSKPAKRILVLQFLLKRVLPHLKKWAGELTVKLMPCKNCESENVQKLSGELTASLPDAKDLKVPPVYICQEVLICIDCGFLEMRVPVGKLELLKKNKAG